MQLQNQNNQNLISQVNNFAQEIKKSGKSPEQIYNEMIASGKFTSSQISQAKSFAQMYMRFFK